MKKIKFKCDHCTVTVKRHPSKVITEQGKKFCTGACQDHNRKQTNA